MRNQLCREKSIVSWKIWGKKERKHESKLFVLRNAGQFIYPRIMDGSGHLGGGGSTSSSGDYERQAKSSGVHNSTRKAAS